MIFGIIFSSFSTTPDIPKTTTTASCADTVLNTNGGNANIEINWEPNVISLRWYNGNTLVESNTCTYDGALTPPPPPPARTGYTFRGWRVRPQMDFSTINTSTNGVSGYGVSRFGYCGYYEKGSALREGGCALFKVEGVTGFDDLNSNEWKVIFNHGTIYGMSKCSDKNGDTSNLKYDNDSSNWLAIEQELNVVTTGETRYCWCKATGYKPVNQSSIYGPSQNLGFVLVRKDGYVGHCGYICEMSCALYFATVPAMRSALFTGQ